MEYIYKYYEVNTSKEINEKRIISLSDLHLEQNITKHELDKLIIKINDLIPQYIFILGDITAYGNIINKDFYKNFLYFLETLTTIAKTYVVFGNHDYLIDSKNKTLFANLNNLLEIYDKTKVKVIHNYLVQEDDFNIVGFDKAPICYSLETKNIKKLRKELLSLLKKIKNILEDQKYTILLTHSHIDFLKLESELFNLFDLILAGHTHNGLVPNGLEKVFKKNQGIITNNKLFLNNVRGLIQEDKMPPIIVNGGITKISSAHNQGIKYLTKNIFKKEIDFIKIKKVD